MDPYRAGSIAVVVCTVVGALIGWLGTSALAILWDPEVVLSHRPWRGIVSFSGLIGGILGCLYAEWRIDQLNR